MFQVLHSYPYGSKKNIFSSDFLKHSTIIVLFRFLNDKRALNEFASRMFGKEKSIIHKAFSLAEKLSVKDNNRPYIVINADQRSNLPMNMRIRIDLFKRNLILTNN